MWSVTSGRQAIDTCSFPLQGSEVLARLMYATLQHHSLLKYSRSLHQLAAFVLVVMGVTREEQAFWTLIGLVRIGGDHMDAHDTPS